MTDNYTHTEPSKSWCRRFHTWCFMANGLGNCSKTACSYGYDRIKANYFGKDADLYVIDEYAESEVEECQQITEK